MTEMRCAKGSQVYPIGFGIGCAALAGMLWGLVFVSPLLLPDYPPVLQSVGRYVAFGLIALPLAWFDRRALGRFEAADWIEATRLAAVGNLLYYSCLAAAIQRAGAPLPTMIIGTLPVVIPLVSNWLAPSAQASVHGRVPWSRLLVPLALTTAGIVAVHLAESGTDIASTGSTTIAPAVASAVASVVTWAEPSARTSTGLPSAILLSLGALACWTWYPIRNSQWMLRHPQHTARSWATAQGLATLPLALAGYLLMWPWLDRQDGFTMPLGPRPMFFTAVMLAVGLLASWLGTSLWNAASQRLPTTIVGAMIVFETLAALGYAYLLRETWPGAWACSGIALLIAGVVATTRMQDAPINPACAGNRPVRDSDPRASPPVPAPRDDRH